MRNYNLQDDIGNIAGQQYFKTYCRRYCDVIRDPSWQQTENIPEYIKRYSFESAIKVSEESTSSNAKILELLKQNFVIMDPDQASRYEMSTESSKPAGTVGLESIVDSIFNRYSQQLGNDGDALNLLKAHYTKYIKNYLRNNARGYKVIYNKKCTYYFEHIAGLNRLVYPEEE